MLRPAASSSGTYFSGVASGNWGAASKGGLQVPQPHPVHLLSQKRTARRKHTSYFTRIEVSVAIQDEVELAVGKGHRVRIGYPRPHDLNAMRGEPLARQLEIRGIVLRGDDPRGPVLPQAQELLAPACVQVDH